MTLPPPGSHLPSVIAGKYRLDALIGEGGMGTVWQATHLRLGKQVAVKIVCPAHAHSIEARWRFQSEARAAARLQSRNVVEIEDIGELPDGTPYLVMELLRGTPLDQRIARGGPVPLAETARILGQVCRVLSRAHAEGIVHRDIKPANIFLARLDGDHDPVVKVLDFGVAKSVTEPRSSTTQTGALVGTPMYASPEQARARKDIDGRSDLYSLGLVAFVMLTGSDPFDADSLADLIIQICTGPLPSLLDRARVALPPALADWFAQACARDPADRFQTADAFAEAFCRACELPAPSRLTTTSDGTLTVPVPAAMAMPVAPPTGLPLALDATQPLAHAQSLGAHVEVAPRRTSRRPALVGIAAGSIFVLVAVAGLVALRFAEPRPARVVVASPPPAPIVAVASVAVSTDAAAPLPSPPASSVVLELPPPASATASGTPRPSRVRRAPRKKDPDLGY